MLGLKMKREYLDNILNESVKDDVRIYNSPTNGKIALIDSKSSSIIGFVDLIETRFISFYEYVNWHINSSFSKENVMEYYKKNLTSNCYKLFYRYCFENPVYLKRPIKVFGKRIVGSWIEFDETKLYV